MTFLEAKSADLASGEALDVVTERPQLASRVRDACSFELWTSLFADDCVLLFQSRDDLIRGSSHTFSRVSKNAGGRPRLASVAFDGRYMGLAL